MQPEFLNLGFKKYIAVHDNLSIRKHFGRTNRCGIYILQFTNNEYYVGKAVDVVRRFAQHRNTYSDIAHVSFKQTGKRELLTIERQTIGILEKAGKKLRNIVDASFFHADSKLDEIVNKKEQEQWFKYELGIESIAEGRQDRPEWRRKYSDRFNKLKQSKYFSNIVEFLENYIQNAIPFPGRTEADFWCCSSLPATNAFSRVSIYWQEVLTINELIYTVNEKKYKELLISFHLGKKELFKTYSKNLLKEKFTSLEFSNHSYRPGGIDQQELSMDFKDAMEFINDEYCLNAIKEFNLRLMRKGRNTSARYHCYDLADVAFYNLDKQLLESASLKKEVL
jgi:hypothetical protein